MRDILAAAPRTLLVLFAIILLLDVAFFAINPEMDKVIRSAAEVACMAFVLRRSKPMIWAFALVALGSGLWGLFFTFADDWPELWLPIAYGLTSAFFIGVAGYLLLSEEMGRFVAGDTPIRSAPAR